MSAALDMWSMIELEKLAHAAMGMTPSSPVLADKGGKAAERFKTLAERWKVNDNEKQKIENIIQEDYQCPSERREAV